jgi:hypothetical protein
MKISLSEYRRRPKETIKIKCEHCAETFSHKSSLHRHRQCKHNKKCSKYFCWICGIEYTRKDNYNRHNNTEKHKRMISHFEDKEEVQQEENPKPMKPEDWYTYMYSIDDLPETKKKQKKQNSTTQMSTNIEPVPTTSNNMQTISFDYREADQMFPEYQSTLRKEPAIIPLTSTMPQSDPRTTINMSFMELLLSDMSAEEIIKTFDASLTQSSDPALEELPTPKADIIPSAQDDNSISENTSEDEDMVILSIQDYELNQTWITLDTCGQPISEEEVEPPTDLLLLDF